MGSRGQSSAKNGRGGSTSTQSLERKGDYLDKRLDQLRAKYRDDRGWQDTDKSEKDPQVIEVREALKKVDDELLNRMVKPIKASELPEGVEDDERNAKLDWDVEKITRDARDFARAHLFNLDKRVGADFKQIWQDAVERAKERAYSYPGEYAKNYRAVKFSTEGSMYAERKFGGFKNGDDFKILRVYTSRGKKMVEAEVTRQGSSHPIKIKEEILSDANGNEYIYHGGQRLGATPGRS